MPTSQEMHLQPRAESGKDVLTAKKDRSRLRRFACLAPWNCTRPIAQVFPSRSAAGVQFKPNRLNSGEVQAVV